MRYIILFLLITSLFCINCKAHWNDSLYRVTSYSDFFQLPEVNTRINLDSIDYSLLDAAIFYQTNKLRAGYGLWGFKYSRALEKSAFEHSVDMGVLNFFEHESVIEEKKTVDMRLELVGTGGSSENIAANGGYSFQRCIHPWDDEEETNLSIDTIKLYPVDDTTGLKRKNFNKTYRQIAIIFLCQWEGSRGHYDNMINFNSDYLGCGVYYDIVSGKFYATQDFAWKDADYTKFPDTLNYKYRPNK